MVDFPISNLSNSGIDRIQVYVKEKPRTLVSHIGTGRHYNINSKSGRLQVLFTDSDQRNNIYNTDIASITKIWNASKKCINMLITEIHGFAAAFPSCRATYQSEG